MKAPMGPPPPKFPNPNPNHNPNPNPNPDSDLDLPAADQTINENAGIEAPDKETTAQAPESQEEAPESPTPAPSLDPSATPPAPQQTGTTAPYTIPPWSEPPSHPFSLEVLKDGIIIEQLNVSEKGAYMFGRVDLCDFVLEHPTISRFHAVLQFGKGGEIFLFDLGSTHGTFINKKQVKKKVHVDVHVGDVIRFGLSSRLYIFQGPSELMLPESDLNKLRNVKMHEEMLDREASLLRARVEASVADGISWGMAEDAVDEMAEIDEDEVTWQTYKGQLTERQAKTRGKIIKRMEKVANMKKEIDAIRAKDIAQGGLTQGQQTQIARNEQRMSQIMEELESLEETLNESILESLGARTRKVAHGSKKGNVEDDDVFSDSDDEFFDRTKKRSSTKKPSEHQQQSVETADTLLDKKEVIINEMEEMKALLIKEREKLLPNNESAQGADDLDAYMSGVASQLVLDKTIQIEKDISNLQAELDKVQYLLKIADPMEEASRKRNSKTLSSKSKPMVADVSKLLQPQPNNAIKAERPVFSPQPEETIHSTQAQNHPEQGIDVCENKEKRAPIYATAKPQWLGYKEGMKSEEKNVHEADTDEMESEKFVDYKDRKKTLGSLSQREEIQHAGPGLLIRKRKPVEKLEGDVDKVPKGSTSSTVDSEAIAADAVALLLKHKRGLHTLDDEEINENQQSIIANEAGQEKSKSKRVLGPSKPAFLDRTPDFESWIPPEGQTGDGRTTLNDRLGY